MPSDAARQPQQPTLIRTPDQLQQAKRPQGSERPDAAPPRGDAEREAGAPAPRPQTEGILGQLETERAHD